MSHNWRREMNHELFSERRQFAIINTARQLGQQASCLYWSYGRRQHPVTVSACKIADAKGNDYPRPQWGTALATHFADMYSADEDEANKFMNLFTDIDIYALCEEQTHSLTCSPTSTFMLFEGNPDAAIPAEHLSNIAGA